MDDRCVSRPRLRSVPILFSETSFAGHEGRRPGGDRFEWRPIAGFRESRVPVVASVFILGIPMPGISAVAERLRSPRPVRLDAKKRSRSEAEMGGNSESAQTLSAQPCDQSFDEILTQ